MVEMIYELSKMQVKEFKLDYELFYFRDRLKGLLETSMIQTELNCLKFSISIDSSIPKFIHRDPQKI